MAEPRRARSHPISLELKHSRAICVEIGERLRQHLARDDAAPVPLYLQELLRRFAAMERAPATVPERQNPERSRLFGFSAAFRGRRR